MRTIPKNLERFDWYAPHQAWLKNRGYSYHDPGDAAASRADLSGADLSRADLSGAYLRGANLSRAEGVATREECIARLDEIRTHIIEHGDPLAMSSWHDDEWSAETEPVHACQTSHCLAGWAQALCPDKKIRQLDPVQAGVLLIPLAAPMFWSEDSVAKKWLEDREYAK